MSVIEGPSVYILVCIHLSNSHRQHHIFLKCTLSIPTSSISHFVDSHFVNSHFVNSHFVNIDIDEVGIDKVEIDNLSGKIPSITAPQDAHKRLGLQVYLGLNTLDFSVIR